MYRSSQYCYEYGGYRLKARLRDGPQPNPADIFKRGKRTDGSFYTSKLLVLTGLGKFISHH